MARARFVAGQSLLKLTGSLLSVFKGDVQVMCSTIHAVFFSNPYQQGISNGALKWQRDEFQRVMAKIALSRARSPSRFSLCKLVPGLLFGSLLGIFSGWIHWLPLLKADWWLRDFVARMAPPAPPDPSLVFLAIDEASLNLSQVEDEEIKASRALSLMADGWPFSRAVYAEAARAVFAAGARAVVFDVSFPLPGRDDDALAALVEDFPDRVIFASVIDLGEGSAPFVTWPSETILKIHSAGDTRAGFVNFFPDADGVVRQAVYKTTLSWVAGLDPVPGEDQYSSLSASTLRAIGAGEKIPEGSCLLRFSAPGAFPRFGLWSVFVPAIWESNLKNGEVFLDRIVLVGPEAPRFQDTKRTPLDPLLPGPELHLNALSAALGGHFLTPVSSAVAFAVCLLGSLLAAGITGVILAPIVAFVLTLLFPVAYFVVAWGAFAYASLVLPLAQPMLALFLSGLSSFAVNFSAERRARAQLRKTFERYVSKDIVRELLDNPSSLLEQLGGTRKQLVVLFSDLRGFTELSESSDPGELVALLNEYLGRMVREIFANAGTVDKFMGDAVMAVWGAVVSRGPASDARAALTTARSMLCALAELNKQWSLEGLPTLRAGIGIHCGPAIFGNIGCEQKMELGVIGDTVNLASRLEGLSKRYGVPIIVSGDLAHAVVGDPPLRRLDTARVAGRSAPVEIFALPVDHNGMPLPQRLIDEYESARLLYVNRDFANAVRAFENILDMFPEDTPSRLMLERCRTLLAEPPGSDWTPVSDWRQK